MGISFIVLFARTGSVFSEDVDDVQLMRQQGSIDYAPKQIEESFVNGSNHFTKTRVDKGLGDFNIKESMMDYMIKGDLNQLDVTKVMADLRTDPLMTYQYTSPAQADLFKHYMTNANLRLLMRYLQYMLMEKDVSEPSLLLRQQAQMDCLRRSGNQSIDLAFKNCVDGRSNQQGAYETLLDPKNNAGYLKGSSALIYDSMIRSKAKGDEWDDSKDFLSEYHVLSNRDIRFNPAKKTFIDYFIEQKEVSYGLLVKALKEYKSRKEIAVGSLANINDEPMAINERIIRRLLILDENQQIIIMKKYATQLALIKCRNKYQGLERWLKRTLNHPQIQSGIKNYINYALNDLNDSWSELVDDYAFKSKTQESYGKAINQVDDVKKGFNVTR